MTARSILMCARSIGVACQLDISIHPPNIFVVAFLTRRPA
jgi:hypothetical protein